MSISAMVGQSDPADAAQAALTAARSIVSSKTLPAEVIAEARELLKVDASELARQIEEGRAQAAQSDGPPAVVPTKVQFALPRKIDVSGISVDGPDLMLTLTGQGVVDGGFDVVANGTVMEIKATGTGSGEVLTTFDVNRPLADKNLILVVHGDAATVRVLGAAQQSAETGQS
jgi:hypothetical protein